MMGKLLVRERFVVIVTAYVHPRGWRDKNTETSAFLSRPKEKGRRGLTFPNRVCEVVFVRASVHLCVCACSMDYVFHRANQSPIQIKNKSDKGRRDTLQTSNSWDPSVIAICLGDEQIKTPLIEALVHIAFLY